jgi:hypothetical protein
MKKIRISKAMSNSEVLFTEPYGINTVPGRPWVSNEYQRIIQHNFPFHNHYKHPTNRL